MKIRELLERMEPVDDVALTISAVLDQLKAALVDSGAREPLSLDTVIHALGDAGIHITGDQFKDMVTKPPLKNTVANVNDREVTFLGHEVDGDEVEGIQPDATTKTLKRMAQSAERRRS